MRPSAGDRTDFQEVQKRSFDNPNHTFTHLGKSLAYLENLYFAMMMRAMNIALVSLSDESCL